MCFFSSLLTHEANKLLEKSVAKLETKCISNSLQLLGIRGWEVAQKLLLPVESTFSSVGFVCVVVICK